MENCIFCNDISDEDILLTTHNFFVVFDIDPIQDGHLLIISKHHIMNFNQLTDDLLLELTKLEQKLIHIIETNFQVSGVTLTMNNAHTMDDNVHFHVHLIPRYAKDTFWNDVKPQTKTFNKQHLKEILLIQ